ncbi:MULTISPECIES: acyl-CoA desaturase [Trichocoleus]|uniref:Acyl-CoA desaturase n=1 Tax=Trichocoleus desertorum GB2-A4 TaxID=2933944 RepID=A0ABV0JAK1_9CYAN|nr:MULTISPECIES: acyl-CoA desaturase [unclassified Trichocoleus]MBD1861510.1 acyl-CoA desaturase [Trichocoleus sp. FACHB-46]MBD2096969.1 acyl-CoA desaturase [Trichocoleus sp. FACHB-591]MBD2122175.1 acyl-CoA desaturase [Trichocoleus sp. FACHB-262]
MTIAQATKPPLAWPIILFMGAIHIGALFAFVPGTFSWGAVGVALFLHWVTGGLGITLGWHRLVTHRSFQTPKWLEYFFVFCGSLACEGGVIEWVGLHRHHHAHSDEAVDHHNSNEGFWWSHMGWMLHKVPAKSEVERLTKDISGDPVYKFLDDYFLLVQFALGVVLYLIGGWPFVVWGIFVRLVLVYHCTWFVNSATHKFGYRSHESDDRSTNCWWVALLTYGEGWHNNHHAYQYSARHGLQWWEIDMTWMTIQLLQTLGLASKVKLPPKEAQAA